MWDFTSSDTLATSHIERSSIEAGKTAAWAEDNMFTTYGNALRDDYHFVPIAAVETFEATNLSLKLVEPSHTVILKYLNIKE